MANANRFLVMYVIVLTHLFLWIVLETWASVDELQAEAQNEAETSNGKTPGYAEITPHPDAEAHFKHFAKFNKAWVSSDENKLDTQANVEESNERTLENDENVPNPDDAVAVKAAWESFKTQHCTLYRKCFRDVSAKIYESESAEQTAYLNFQSNLRNVSEHNRLFATGKSSYTMRINEYSDWSLSDVQTMLLGLTAPPDIPDSKRSPASEYLPRAYLDQAQESGSKERLLRRQAPQDTLDYRQQGWVTSVKQQAHCGCCWAVAAVGAIEGQYYRIFGQSRDLSFQNLVDCSRQNMGCNGGWPAKAFEDVARGGGIMAETDYPFIGWRQPNCMWNPANAIPNLQVTDSRYLPAGDEAALRDAVWNVGPIAVAIDATPAFQMNFVNYGRGVYVDNWCSSWPGNHAVLVVGYGSENGLDYWLVKNSWGTGWGQGGYVKMVRNMNNHCGIASNAAFPVLMESGQPTPASHASGWVEMKRINSWADHGLRRVVGLEAKILNLCDQPWASKKNRASPAYSGPGATKYMGSAPSCHCISFHQSLYNLSQHPADTLLAMSAIVAASGSLGETKTPRNKKLKIYADLWPAASNRSLPNEEDRVSV